MREYKISRQTYQIATKQLLEKAGFEVKSLGTGKIRVRKNSRSLYIDIAGKYLPYFGENGKQVFPWETHIKALRLNRTEDVATKLGCEPWICFCYCILDDKFKRDFANITKVGDKIFGIKLISLNNYKSNMRPRSNSWDVVELSREKVPQLTKEANNI